MDKKILGLVGAITALGAPQAVQAAPAANPTDVLKVESYADLLNSIPNAAQVLKAVDTTTSSQPARIDRVQYYHHHHHHHWMRRFFRHHHHHHHHHHMSYFANPVDGADS
jgi:G3E family GTPase